METINLDLTPGRIPPVCHTSQYDIGRVIRINLLDGESPHTLAGTEEISLRTRKPNGETVVEEVENTADSYVEIVTSKDTCDISGENWCELEIDTIGTHNFKMSVEHDAYDGNLSTGSASGLIASFTTDLAEGLPKCEVDIEYTQDLHGYESSWAGGAGKNLWNAVDGKTTLTDHGVTFTVNSDGSISLSGTSEQDNYASFDLAKILTLTPGETYVFSGGLSQNVFIRNSSLGVNDYGTGVSFVVDSNTSNNNWHIRVKAGGVNVDGITIYPQIEAGSIKTEYAPYENYCPFELVDNVVVTNNRGNFANFVNGKGISQTGAVTTEARRFATVDKIPIDHRMLYYVRKMGQQGCSFIFAIYKDDTLIRREISHVDGDIINTSGGNFMRIAGYGASDVTVTVEDALPMVVIDSEIDSYIPFEQTESEVIISDGSQVNIPFDYSGSQYSIDLVLGEDNSLNWNGTNSSSSTAFLKPTSIDIDDENAFFDIKPGPYELRVEPYVGDDAQVELMVNAARGSSGETYVTTPATRNICVSGYKNCFIRFRVTKQKTVDVDDGEYGLYSIGAAKGKIDLVSKKVYITQILFRVLPNVSNLTYTTAGAYRFSTPSIYRNDGSQIRTGLTECGEYEIRGPQSTTYIRHINGIDDLDTFKEFIKVKPIHVPYNLAEPVVMDISMLNITTFVGKNNIMSTNGTVDIEYYKTNRG